MFSWEIKIGRHRIIGEKKCRDPELFYTESESFRLLQEKLAFLESLDYPLLICRFMIQCGRSCKGSGPWLPMTNWSNYLTFGFETIQIFNGS